MIESSNVYCKESAFWKDFYKAVIEDMGVVKDFYNMLMQHDISKRDWMKFPETELRKDIIEASLHPIIYFVESR